MNLVVQDCTWEVEVGVQGHPRLLSQKHKAGRGGRKERKIKGMERQKQVKLMLIYVFSQYIHHIINR